MTILPMLASPTSGASNRRPITFEEIMRTGDWVADVKMDGVRALVHWDASAARLTNRNGVDVTYRYPDLATMFSTALKGMPECMLDGEIVAQDGSFEHTLLRDQQESPKRILAMVEQHPVAYVAFDAPEFGTPWEQRRRKLGVLVAGGLGPQLTLTALSPDADFLERTRELGMEGVIAKRLNSRYEFGKRSRNWLKFKNLHRVSALVAGYLPGNGARKDFGSMVLAMLSEDGNPVEVGRVGTGFTEREIPKLKGVLDAGTLLIVEIEALGVTTGGVLRMPVYRGVRSDIEPTACTVDQLATLPRT